jgi:AsmA protein
VRILKWVALVVASLVVLLLIAVLVMVWFVDPNGFKPRIEAAVRDATGRDLALVGDIKLGFFPWLSLRAGEGHFGNAQGFGSEPMVSWKSAQLGAKLFPLLRGELVADRVHIDGADVRLVRHADGKANWEGIGGNEPARAENPADERPTELRIDGIDITNSRVSFIDESVPRRVEVTALTLSTDGIEPGKPFTDTEISGRLLMDGFKAAVPFAIGVPRVILPKDFSSIDVDKFEITFGGLNARGSVQGTLGAAPHLDGKLATNEFDPRELLATVGIAAPKTTDPKALGRLAIDGEWKLDAGAIGVEPIAITVDDTKLSGTFHRAAGEDPVGDFILRGDTIDLARYIPPPDPASAPFVLPTAALKALKFRGTLELEHAKLDDVLMKGVTLRLLLDEQGLRGEKKP